MSPDPHVTAMQMEAAREELQANQIKRQMAQEQLERFRTSDEREEPNLRDLFAAFAAAGLLASNEALGGSQEGRDHVAHYAFKTADAMLAERGTGS